jgi:hypothetical protein
MATMEAMGPLAAVCGRPRHNSYRHVCGRYREGALALDSALAMNAFVRPTLRSPSPPNWASRSDASLREKAEGAVRAVELQLEVMKRAGDLRPVTRAYKQYRLARAAEGQGAQSWYAWFAKLQS